MWRISGNLTWKLRFYEGPLNEWDLTIFRETQNMIQLLTPTSLIEFLLQRWTNIGGVQIQPWEPKVQRWRLRWTRPPRSSWRLIGATRYPEGRYQTWRKAASKSTINGGFSGKITPNWKVDSSKPVSIGGPMWNLTHSYFAGRRKLPKFHPVEGLPVGTCSVSRRWHADKSANRSYCLNTGYGEKELDGNRLKVRSTLCVS